MAVWLWKNSLTSIEYLVILTYELHEFPEKPVKGLGTYKKEKRKLKYRKPEA